MGRRITAGLVGGLVAGVVFGIMMQVMTVPTPDGMQIPMIVQVAAIVGSTSAAVGWLYHLFNSALIGAIFGWLMSSRTFGYGSGLGWGAVYGFAWWILGGLIIMPLFLGMPAFAPLLMPEMQTVAMGSLMGHLIYGLVLGFVYAAIVRRTPAAVPV